MFTSYKLVEFDIVNLCFPYQMGSHHSWLILLYVLGQPLSCSPQEQFRASTTFPKLLCLCGFSLCRWFSSPKHQEHRGTLGCICSHPFLSLVSEEEVALFLLKAHLPFIQSTNIYIKYLLFDRYCTRSWGYSGEQSSSHSGGRGDQQVNKKIIKRLPWWLSGKKIFLPVQEDMGSVPSLEDSTCHGATKPVCHNYWACALEPGSHNYWAHIPELLKPKCPRARAPQQEKSLQWGAHTLQLESSPRSLQLEKACMQQQRPSTAKTKYKIEKEFTSWSTHEKHIFENCPETLLCCG